MFSQILNYENKFFVNGVEIPAIESLDLSYSNNAQTKKLIGFGQAVSTIAGSTQQKLSITRNVIYTDPIYGYAVNGANISGSLNYNNNHIGFRSGYVDKYMVSCAIGSIPKVTTNITIYDELVSGSKNASGSLSSPAIDVPNQGSISLTCDNVTTNRVVGFDYSIKSTIRPVYSIGSKFPTEILFLAPLEYAASVQIDINDAFLQNAMSFLNGRQNKDLSFEIKGRNLRENLASLTIPNASLVAESLSSNADGGIKLTLNYIGHS